MVLQKILAHPWIALAFLLILALLWLAAWRRDRRDAQLKRRSEAKKEDKQPAVREAGEAPKTDKYRQSARDDGSHKKP
jgi:type VI protein secretion system component VasK